MRIALTLNSKSSHSIPTSVDDTFKVLGSKRHLSCFRDACGKADSLVHFAVEPTIQTDTIPESAAQRGHMLQILPTLLCPPLVAGQILDGN
jgi:hypothetical protein